MEVYVADHDDGEICQNTRALLRNEFRDDRANSINYEWYRTPIGGPIAGTGQAFLTPPISGDRTYYADFVANYNVGPESNEGANNDFPPLPSGGIRFDAHIPLTLKSVLIYSNRRDICEVELLDSENNVLDTREILLNAAGENRMFLNFEIPRGEGYVLNLKALSLSFSTEGAEFPYDLEGILTLTGNSLQSTGDKVPYLYFYDWEIEHSEPCGRPELPVVVSPLMGAPVAEFSSSTTTVDINNDPTVQFVDASANAVSWEWNFDDGTRSNDQNPSHTFTELGIHLISLTVTNSDGCTASTLGIIEVVNSPSNTNNFTELQGIQVYPNPTSEFINIETSFASTEDLSIQMTDLLGRPVKNFEQKRVQSGTFRIETSDLTTGIYLLVLKTENGRAVRKVMKI